MNPIGFILEVPAELQMRRKQRKKDDIINLAVLLPKNCVHDKGAVIRLAVGDPGGDAGVGCIEKCIVCAGPAG